MKRQHGLVRRRNSHGVPYVVLLMASLLGAGNATFTLASPTFPDQAVPKAESQTAPTQPKPANPAPASEKNKREELEAEIRALETQRAEFLILYSSAHPDVRAVERKLRLRRKQLEALEAKPVNAQ